VPRATFVWAGAFGWLGHFEEQARRAGLDGALRFLGHTDDVASFYAGCDVVIQTSMNLTRMAYQGQWNQAQVMRSAAVYEDYLRVFKQARQGGRVTTPYHTAALGNVVNYFFPRPRATADEDPVMQALSGVRCTGSRARGTKKGRTKIRVVQYAMHGTRGVWIAKRLRKLSNAGCNIAIIYAVTNGYLDDVAIEDVRAWEDGFHRYLKASRGKLLAAMKEKKALETDIESSLKEAIIEYKKTGV